MKRFAWGFVALILLSSSTLAQDVDYGIIGGLGFSFFDGYDENAGVITKVAPGINLGATGSFEYKDNIFLRGTIAYSKYFAAADEFTGGYKIDYSVSDFALEGDANYYINDNMYGIAGIGIHMVTYSVEWTGWGYWFDGTYDYGETKIGLHVGGGYKLSDQLAVEAKYILVGDVPQLKVSAVYYLGTYSF